MLKKFLPFYALLIFIISCHSISKPKDVQQENGFYLWKTRLNFDQNEYNLLDSFNTKVIYMRLFDVDFDEKKKTTRPLGELEFYYSDYSPYEKYEVVPTIFITNNTFKNIQEQDISELANRIYKKIISHFSEMGDQATSYNHYYSDIENDPFMEKSMDFRELVRKDSLSRHYYNRVKEIQFDCDWTESTKDKYFTFLSIMQAKFKEKTISSTIRLYQYKYPEKAGIPPVKKGMLMCYNVGDVREVNGPNSIFNKNEILKYLNRKEPYPITLDYAFPIFEWGAIYRNNQLIKLLPVESFNTENSNYKLISKPKEIQKYELLEETELYSFNFTLQKGDIVKIESIDYSDVIYIAKKVSSINTNPNPKIILFDFETKNVRQHESSIKKVFDCF